MKSTKNYRYTYRDLCIIHFIIYYKIDYQSGVVVHTSNNNTVRSRQTWDK